MTAYSDVYIEHSSAYFTALNADEQWQRELDFQNIDRYSPEARGSEGSALRMYYNAKLKADESLRLATDNLRSNGRVNEILTLAD